MYLSAPPVSGWDNDVLARQLSRDRQGIAKVVQCLHRTGIDSHSLFHLSVLLFIVEIFLFEGPLIRNEHGCLKNKKEITHHYMLTIILLSFLGVNIQRIN